MAPQPDHRWRQTGSGSLDLHSAIGFWTSHSSHVGNFWNLLRVPDPFQAVVDFFDPFDSLQRQPRVRRHDAGVARPPALRRFAGWSVKALWAVFGLVPRSCSSPGR